MNTPETNQFRQREVYICYDEPTMLPLNNFDQAWDTAKKEASQTAVETIEHGWEQHVILDHKNKLVYRYPRNANAANKLTDEIQLLKDLNQQDWPIQIPRLLEHTEHFSVYSLIEGDVLTEEVIAGIDDQQMHVIGSDLGVFLARLHGSDKQIVERKITKQSMSLHEYYDSRIRGQHTSNYRPRALEDLERLGVPNPSDQVVVHGDLHGLNMVIDPVTKVLVGVIDFSEVELGDPHQDFRKLFMADERLLDPAVSAYKNSSGIQLSTSKIKLWAYVNEWANICYFHDQPENSTYMRAFKHLKKWGRV